MKSGYYILFVCWLFLSAGAATYYVDPDAGADTNNGTATNTAWAHMPLSIGITSNTNGWVQLVNGDKLIVKGGTTNFSAVKLDPQYYSGSAAFDSIVIQSGHLFTPQWGSTRAIVDGGVTNVYGFWLHANSGTLDGITIDGFEVRMIEHGGPGGDFGSTGSSCFCVGGNNQVNFMTLRRNYMHDAYRNGDDTGFGVEFVRGTDFIITQNIVGTNIGTKGIEPYRGLRGAISNNWVWGTGDHSIALTTCTNVDVCNNVVVGYGPHVHEPVYSIAASGSSRCDVWNNLMFITPPVSQLVTNSYPDLLYVYGVINGANTLSWKSQVGIGQYTTCISNRWLHNTIAYFNDSGNGADSTAIQLCKTLATSIDGTVCSGNLLYSNNNAFSGSFYVGNTNIVTNTFVQYNDFFRAAESDTVMGYYDGAANHYSTVANFLVPGTYTANLELDPVLVKGTLPSELDTNFRPNTDYFALQDSSPASVRVTAHRPAGSAAYGYDSSTGKFNLDIIGNTRSSWSMGAYEYQGQTKASLTGNLSLSGNARIGQ